MEAVTELGYFSDVTEFIPGRLYFATSCVDSKLRNVSDIHCFSIDSQLVYRNFYSDFGPLNLAMLYRYCQKLNRKLRAPALAKKILVHYTAEDEEKRANAAFLIGSYAIIYLHKTPETVLRILEARNTKPYLPFRDASFGLTCHTIPLLACFQSLCKAAKYNFFDFRDFDVDEYEYYERVETGDFNWMVPGKFLAFCGPHSQNNPQEGQHTPESYFPYFRKYNVTTVIRLNKRIYEASRFTQAGFAHKDLIYTDGSTPSDAIMEIFLSTCEQAPGAVAVHCKAGLGRTGTLISCYLMKHYRFTAHEAIAWLRICRPGSVIGHQQTWLEEKQLQLWLAGDSYCENNKDRPLKIRCEYPVYSLRQKDIQDSQAKAGSVSSVLGILGSFKLDDKTNQSRLPKTLEVLKEEEREDAVDDTGKVNEEEIIRDGLSQGDRLNRIKASRKHMRANTTCPLNCEDFARPRSRTTGTAVHLPKISLLASPLKANRISAVLPGHRTSTSFAEAENLFVNTKESTRLESKPSSTKRRARLPILAFSRTYAKGFPIRLLRSSLLPRARCNQNGLASSDADAAQGSRVTRRVSCPPGVSKMKRGHSPTAPSKQSKRRS